MAYLLDIHRPRCAECTKYATVELRNNVNGTVGLFCATHGRAALRRQQATEEAAYTDRRGV